MTSAPDTSLNEQREILRQRLHIQRKLITHKLNDHTLGAHSSQPDQYPRSITMRFLTRQPALAGRIVAEIATILLGARLLTSARTILSIARMVRSVSISQPKTTTDKVKRLPAP